MNGPHFAGHPRFEIIRQLGRGSIGVVYLARDLEREQEVALKTLSSSDPQALFSLKREFRSLAKLRHTNLAKMYDLFADGTEPFFTLELVRGESMLAYCRRDKKRDSVDVWASTVGADDDGIPCDTNRVRQVLPQLISGLQALHNVRILHRDIKPTNVMVTHDGTVKILDFGLAVNVDTDLTPRLVPRSISVVRC